jgi:hypothetical protein
MQLEWQSAPRTRGCGEPVTTLCAWTRPDYGRDEGRVEKVDSLNLTSTLTSLKLEGSFNILLKTNVLLTWQLADASSQLKRKQCG